MAFSPIHSACHSAGSRMPIDQQAGSLQRPSPRVVLTFTRQKYFLRDRSVGPSYSTRIERSEITVPESHTRSLPRLRSDSDMATCMRYDVWVTSLASDTIFHEKRGRGDSMPSGSAFMSVSRRSTLAGAAAGQAYVPPKRSSTTNSRICFFIMMRILVRVGFHKNTQIIRSADCRM